MSTTTTAPTTFRADRFRKLYEANVAETEIRFNMQFLRRDSDCGTAACAFGNYALAHPEEGVEFVQLPSCRDFTIRVPECGETSWSSWNRRIAAHLGITDYEATYLFGAFQYTDPSKTNVLARLRAFAAERGLELPEYQGEGAGT